MTSRTVPSTIRLPVRNLGLYRRRAIMPSRVARVPLIKTTSRTDVPFQGGSNQQDRTKSSEASGFARRPLTGQVIIEWVDAADPDDPSEPPELRMVDQD